MSATKKQSPELPAYKNFKPDDKFKKPTFEVILPQDSMRDQNHQPKLLVVAA